MINLYYGAMKKRHCVQTLLLATAVSTDIWRSSIFRGLTWIRVWPPCTWIITRINEVYKVCVLVNLIYGHDKGRNSSLWESKWFSKGKKQSLALSWWEAYRLMEECLLPSLLQQLCSKKVGYENDPVLLLVVKFLPFLLVFSPLF